MLFKKKFKDINNQLGNLVRYINGLGVNDGYPNDITQVLKLQEKKYSDIRDNNLKAEDDQHELHHRHIRATANTLEEYFINNGRGFYKPDIIQKINNLNINIEIYSKQLTTKKLSKVIQDIKKTFDEMRKYQIEINPHELETIKLYIFNNYNDYRHYGSKFRLGLGNEGGMHYYIGRDNILSKIYLFQAGNVHNLVHEIVHANIASITRGKKVPTVINEGIAEKIQYDLGQDYNTRGKSIDVSIEAAKRQLIGDYDLSKILQLDYSNDLVLNTLLYRVGHALTMYFDEQNTSILSHYLYTISSSNNLNDANMILYQSYNKDKFKTFLVKGSTDSEMKGINALKVEYGEKLATINKLVEDEYKDVIYYIANIKAMNTEEIVGQFSPVFNYYIGHTIRIALEGTRLYLDLSAHFHFLKVIRNKGTLKLVYCDKDGTEYKDSLEYQKQLDIIKQKCRSVDYQNIIEKLTYFGLNVVRNIRDSNFIDYVSDGAIFVLQGLSKHEARLSSGISIYSNKQKIAELSGDATVIQVIGDSKVILHHDILMGMYTTYPEAYVAIRQEEQTYNITFIEGRSVNADQYFDTPHIHIDPLFVPTIFTIEPSNLNTKLLIRNINILDHIDSETSQYSKNHRASKHTISQGKLLDDKGTERAIDDVYEAEIAYLGDTVHTFRNIGFCISEDGDFFISDTGSNHRYQLPKEITHLKLIHLIDDDGNKIERLVPVTQNSNEWPDGMPNIPDQYRYIDPIFAHQYEKEDHSHEHITIGLINFDQYPIDTLFEIKYDPYDYHIKRNKQGNILRDNKNYFTKVKIYDPNGKELGMLSNDFHHFKGKLFISFDYNYSYKDFLMSYAPKITYQTLEDGTRVGVFEQSEADINNNNYRDYKKVVISSNRTLSKQNDVTIPVNLLENEGSTTIFEQEYIGNNLITPDPVNILTTNIHSNTILLDDHNHIGGTGINTAQIVAAGMAGGMLTVTIGGIVYGVYRIYNYINKKHTDNSNNLTVSDSQSTYNVFNNIEYTFLDNENEYLINNNKTANQNLPSCNNVTFNIKKGIAQYCPGDSKLSHSTFKYGSHKLATQESIIYDVPSYPIPIDTNSVICMRDSHFLDGVPPPILPNNSHSISLIGDELSEVNV